MISEVNNSDLFSVIPEEVSLKILSYLRPGDLGRCQRVSTVWLRISRDDSLWIPHIRRFIYPKTIPYRCIYYESSFKLRITLAIQTIQKTETLLYVPEISRIDFMSLKRSSINLDISTVMNKRDAYESLLNRSIRAHVKFGRVFGYEKVEQLAHILSHRFNSATGYGALAIEYLNNNLLSEAENIFNDQLSYVVENIRHVSTEGSKFLLAKIDKLCREDQLDNAMEVQKKFFHGKASQFHNYIKSRDIIFSYASQKERYDLLNSLIDEAKGSDQKLYIERTIKFYESKKMEEEVLRIKEKYAVQLASNTPEYPFNLYRA